MEKTAAIELKIRDYTLEQLNNEKKLLDLSKEEATGVSYKYAIYDLEDKTFRYFENGPDRYAPINKVAKSVTMIYNIKCVMMSLF